MKYQFVEDKMHEWFDLFRGNNERGFEALDMATGEAQASFVAGAMPESNHMVLNFTRKFLEKEKGDVSDFELWLKVSNRRVGMPAHKREQIELILQDIILNSDHLTAFQDVLKNVYDFGYGVVCIYPMQSEDDFKNHITIRNIPHPYQCFFDPSSGDSNYMTGKFCGMRYFQKDPKEEKDKEIIDVFYRKKEKETVYLDTNGVVWDEKAYRKQKKRDKFLHCTPKKVERDGIYFKRFINGKSASPSLFTGCRKYLPLVFWNGLNLKSGLSQTEQRSVPQTVPFCSNIAFSQHALNIVASELVNQVNRSSREDILMIPDQLVTSQAGTGGVEETLRKGGVLNMSYSMSDNSPKIPPQLQPSTPIDPNLMNAFQLFRETLFFMAGQPQGGEQGTEGSSTTGEATKQKRKNALYFKKMVMENHLKNINKVGQVLLEMMPHVYKDTRIFYFGSDRVTINSYGEEPLCSILKKLKIDITYAYSSESEKENNLDVIEKLVSVLPAEDVNSRKLYNLIAAENLHGEVADIAKRMMEIDMDQDTLRYAKGILTKGEYERKLREKQEAASQGQQPDPLQQKLEVEQMKAETDRNYKQGKLQLDEEKAKAQLMKDQQDAMLKQEKIETPVTENINVNRK